MSLKGMTAQPPGEPKGKVLSQLFPEAESRIYVSLDHIKREVIEATKAPNCERQQKRRLPCRVLKKQERRGQRAQKKEQDSLCLNPSWAAEIFHALEVSERRSPYQFNFNANWNWRAS